MNTGNSRVSAFAAKLSALLGSASLFTMATAISGQDRALGAQSVDEIPENVLVTGSLIRGTVAVGVPVINISPMDFAQVGALTTADLFKNFPAANFSSGDIGTTAAARIDRGQKINLRNLDTTNSVRELLLIDGLRFPPQGNGLCAVDPSIIPTISLDHVDILVDGASAVYGSDALAGVVNITLRRNFDGAMTQLRFTHRAGGANRYQVAQLWGRTWDGGQITLSYEWLNELPIKGKEIPGFGLDHTPWGFDDRTPIGSSTPGIITRAPFPTGANVIGPNCGPGGTVPATSSVCYSIPVGAGANWMPGSTGFGPGANVAGTAPWGAATLNWTSFSADSNFAGPLNVTAGTRNLVNPYSRAWYSPYEDKSGGHITLDQRLTQDISFFFNGFYTNRRSRFLNSTTNNPGGNFSLTQVPVPTLNPYYPTGGAPTNLRVSYDMSLEMQPMVDGNELASRYHFGLNISLPAGWAGQVYYAQTYDSNYDVAFNNPNKNAVSAALGWTINPLAPSGTGPSFGTWTKPGFVPYLNLFCDPSTFACNSPTTLNYITSQRVFTEKWWINQKGVNADGPLFDIPGGTVKMAVGMNYIANAFTYFVADNTTNGNLTVNGLTDAMHQNVWAAFTQINIPLFSETNARPLLKRVDLEVSWRHDQYDTVGGTTNPKVSFNWSPVDDFTIRGGWGTNFRAPGFGELSPIAKSVIQQRNMPLLGAGQGVVSTCAVAGDPLPGRTSGAGKIQYSAVDFINAMAAAGAPGFNATNGCVNVVPNLSTGSSTVNPFVTGLLQPAGIASQGGAPVNEAIRQWTDFGRQNLWSSTLGRNLEPEKSANYSIGIQYTPTNFLRGLDIQATYYVVKITSALRQFGGGGFNETLFSDPTKSFAFPMPAELTDPLSGARMCPDIANPNPAFSSIPIPANLVPSACPTWVNAMATILANPKGTVQGSAATAIMFINDAATVNTGWLKLDGIDFNWSYDWDMGDIGAFNIGAVGTYYLHQYEDATPGVPGSQILDNWRTTTGSTNALAQGVSTLPRFGYRGRFGWSNGAWNITGFMDYRSHLYSSQAAPPNVNNSCATPKGTVGGGTHPCAINNYTNLQPPWYSFDLAVGYNTGDTPQNEYLKNIGIQMVIQNIFDKHQPYSYIINPFPCSCGGTQANFGRMVSFIVMKTW
jgi:outer membrane receptor protein involved in Fe transport